MTPTVSVIIPCYNSGSTLSDTLDSLQKQTFGDWEAIVVNDGATDDSAETIGRYRSKDPRIKQIDQDNQGLPSARNAGLSVASGEFVNFLDADDLLLPDMLQNTVRRLRDDPSLAAAYCGWIYSDAEAHDLRWVVTPQLEGQLFEKLAHGNRFPCHSVLLRREVLRDVGPFDCSLRHCHDWDLWIRVARIGGHFGSVPEALVIYRMVPGSLSRSPLTLFEAGKEVIRRGHNPDDRVKNPVTEFKQGCRCPVEEVTFGWCLRCVGNAIAKGDAVQASQLFETVFDKGNYQMALQKIGTIRHDLWFSGTVSHGDWEALWARMSRPLLQFLLRQEERLEVPGFAMQCLLEIVRRHRPMSGRAHLSALRDKIMQRLLRRNKPNAAI